MGNKILKKKITNQSVLDAARERFDIIYSRYDKVVVSFSGGKDSTVCLNLAIEAATKVGKLPIDVYFFDEEAIQPETVAYVQRVSQLETVNLKWICVPIRHRNACSRHQPWWFPWNPDDESLWVRPLPECSITKIPGFTHGMTMPESVNDLYGPEHGTVAHVRGIRADESLRRYRSVARKTEENWISGPQNGYAYHCSPIYDWTTVDVWTAPQMFGWDYNKTYDVLSMAGVPPNQQRVCPPFGEEPLRGLWQYSVCWPELWHAMINRVDGAATAARYSQTDLYGFGGMKLPDGQTWISFIFLMLELYPYDLRAKMAASVYRCIDDHQKKTRRPMPTESPDPLTGYSWMFLAELVNRGDLKGRRAGNVSSKASQYRDKHGLSLDDVSNDTGDRY